MMSLRQRLLLVAGWAVAAVATGLVSAGAVAVAGGQVNDRPLRPLSAAEVAALPVIIEDLRVTSEPLASGGSASPAGTLTPGGASGPDAPGDDTARPAEKELSTAADRLPPEDLIPSEEQVAAALAAAEEEERDPEIPTVGPRPPEPEVVDVVGGRVSVSLVDGAVVLNAATPRPGFVTDLLFDRSDELTVTFWDGTHLSTVLAVVIGGELLVTPTETGP